MRFKLGSTKTIFIDRCAQIFRESFTLSFYIILYNQQYKRKNDKWYERKTDPPPLLLKSTEESIVNENSFIVLEYWVFCILQTFVKQEK